MGCGRSNLAFNRPKAGKHFLLATKQVFVFSITIGCDEAHSNNFGTRNNLNSEEF